MWWVLLLVIGLAIIVGFVLLKNVSHYDDTNPPNTPVQTAPIRITNSCPYTLWIEARCTTINPNTGAFIAGTPIPGYPTPIKLNSMSFIDFNMPTEGLAGCKFWAKYGCDENGDNCSIGDSMQKWGGWDNPNGGCPSTGCTPPIDSIFEITFGCSNPDPTKCSKNPSDPSSSIGNVSFFDTSQVDGYTLPYKVYIKNGSSCDNGAGLSLIDGSGLTMSKCPSTENLSLNGKYPTATDSSLPKTYDTISVDLSIQDSTGKKVGCMSPCQKMTYGQPFGFNQKTTGSNISIPSTWYCCPTPGNMACNTPNQLCSDGTMCMGTGVCESCNASVGCTSATSCQSGPNGTVQNGDGITSTQYVKNVHEMTNNSVYAFAYDDGIGLHTCPTDKNVMYEIEFLPL